MKRALDDAARRWPEERGARSRLLVRLVGEGHAAICALDVSEADNRRRALERTAGQLTGAYGADYLAELRGDWPT